MDIIKEKTACFTGHRPEKLSSVVGSEGPALEMLKSMLFFQIQQAIEDGYECFISGLARGVDLWAAEYVIEMKKKYPNVRLVCAMPFEAHSKGFRGADLWSLRNVLDNADEVVVVSKEYSKFCYKNRNYYMVDNSSRLIAVIDDFKSGTGQTVNYARKQGIDIRMINVRDYASENCCKKYQNPFQYKLT